jgi:hypothetical protein
MLVFAAAAWACTDQAVIGTPAAGSDGGSALQPEDGPPGTQVRVEGRKFYEREIEIRWNSPDGPLLATAHGPEFETEITAPNQPAGHYTVLALVRDENGDIDAMARAHFRLTAERDGTGDGGSGSSSGSGSGAPENAGSTSGDTDREVSGGTSTTGDTSGQTSGDRSTEGGGNTTQESAGMPTSGAESAETEKPSETAGEPDHPDQESAGLPTSGAESAETEKPSETAGEPDHPERADDGASGGTAPERTGESGPGSEPVADGGSDAGEADPAEPQPSSQPAAATDTEDPAATTRDSEAESTEGAAADDAGGAAPDREGESTRDGSRLTPLDQSRPQAPATAEDGVGLPSTASGDSASSDLWTGLRGGAEQPQLGEPTTNGAPAGTDTEHVLALGAALVTGGLLLLGGGALMVLTRRRTAGAVRPQ